MWDEITYPFPNFNCCTVDVWEWTRNFVPHLTYNGCTLQWRHNGRDGVSNHHPHDCSLNRLFRRRSKKTPKLRVTGLCSPVTAQMAVTQKMLPFDDVIMNYISMVRLKLIHVNKKSPWDQTGTPHHNRPGMGVTGDTFAKTSDFDNFDFTEL